MTKAALYGVEQGRQAFIEKDVARVLPTRVFRVLAHIGLLFMLGAAAPALAGDWPNILVLMAEDMSSRVGSFGDQVAITPNIDQLAEEGVSYTNVFTTAGVCAPSRAAFITGMHQISIGAQHMRTSTRPEGAYKSVPPTYVKAFPEYLRQAGYFTFTDMKLDYQFSGVFSGSGPFTVWDDEGRNTNWSGRKNGQPFFGLINFAVTHESGVFPPLGNWPNDLGHFISQVFRFLSGIAPGAQPVRPEEIILEPYYPDTETVRVDIARHYNNIHEMDRQVGEILAQLETDGLLDSTIIIWTTDHGDGLPRAKRDLYDSGIRVPMIVRWPDDQRGGTTITRLVSFIDLAPTILRLVGVEIPKHMQGSDFLEGHPRDFVYASRDRIDAFYDRRRAVRDHRFKYIRNWYPEKPTGHWLAYRDNIPMVRELWQLFEANQLNEAQRKWFEATGEEQLFDLVDDPHELDNLAGDPDFEQVRQRMQSQLAQRLREIGDASNTLENDMVAEINPGGIVPTTAPPVFNPTEGVLEVETPGASIGYRLNDGPWLLYSEPVRVESGDRLTAKAVRYGWQESEVKEYLIP